MYKVSKHNVTPTTEFAAQLSARVKREIYTGGYYVASGQLDNGDTIEMIIAEEREPGLQGKSRYVYVALNGRCNLRRYPLDGAAAQLADWLRGHHTGRDEPISELGIGGLRLLTGLYADING